MHEETVRIVDAQMETMATQMKALDDFVIRARAQNALHQDKHSQSLKGLSSTVRSSYDNINTHFTYSYERVRDMGVEMSAQTASLRDALAPLDQHLREPLAHLRSDIERTEMQEYQPTGDTPQKIQYTYPMELPRTDAHDILLAAMRNTLVESQLQSPTKAPTTIPVVFHDEKTISNSGQLSSLHSSRSSRTTPDTEQRPGTSGGLREIDANLMNISAVSVSASSIEDSTLSQITNFKKSVRSEGKLPVSKIGKKSMVSLEGRENTIELNTSLMVQQSTGRRRSPRTG